MSEITDLLQQRAGLSPEQAQQVEAIVVEHIMTKVPPQFQGIVGQVLGQPGQDGQDGQGGGAGLLGAVEGLFGNKG